MNRFYENIEYFQDPLIQFVCFIILTVLVMDGFKLILNWVWKKIGGHDDH